MLEIYNIFIIRSVLFLEKVLILSRSSRVHEYLSFLYCLSRYSGKYRSAGVAKYTMSIGHVHLLLGKTSCAKGYSGQGQMPSSCS
jgi:hypothetical protein